MSRAICRSSDGDLPPLAQWHRGAANVKDTLFGQTAAQRRDTHPDAEGNLRDRAPIEQLVVLTNLESNIKRGQTALFTFFNLLR